MKVFIKMQLQYEKENICEELEGIFKEDDQELIFKDLQQDTMHFYLKDKIFVRETGMSIFSYKLEEKGSLKVYLKEEKREMSIPIQVFLYEVSETTFQVHYKIEGNDQIHQLRLDWGIKK